MHHVSFASIESSMYKRRRLNQPAIPSAPDTAGDALLSSRHALVNGRPFYRGLADDDDNRSALTFATDEQLMALKEADHVYFDATFKIVPAIYYQLFTVFVPFADTAFPVFYALMTRKSQDAYRAVFNKVHNLVSDFKPVSAMADYEDASVAAPVTTTTQPSLNPSTLHHPQPQQLLSAPTILRCARCASSHNAPTSHSCHVVMSFVDRMNHK